MSNISLLTVVLVKAPNSLHEFLSQRRSSSSVFMLRCIYSIEKNENNSKLVYQQ